MTDMDAGVLVTGATGKTGRRIAARLRASGVPVRDGSRRADPPFDWADRGTWEDALRGVGAAYLTYFPDLAVPGAAETVGELAEHAVGLGVRRLVLLSGRGEVGAQYAEQLVQASGADCTVIRSAWFMQNFSEGHLLDPVLSGVVALPAGDIAEPFVDVDDITDVAIAAFSDDRHIGQLYEVTGPRLLTFAAAAAEIGDAIGRDVEYRDVAGPEARDELIRIGLPAEMADDLTALFAEVLDGHNGYLTDGVQKALDREPRDFADFARAAAASGAWNPR
jgi:uncharacterized protein YbjT (DUF2867 family)